MDRIYDHGTSSLKYSCVVLQVSYGARTTSSKTENIPTFYRTLPASDTVNIGRLALLVNHAWLRIAILKSNQEEYYSEVSCPCYIK